MNKINLTHFDIGMMIIGLAQVISNSTRQMMLANQRSTINVYPIPRGGVPVAYALQNHIRMNIVDKPEDADVFIDDIIDSGSTMRKFCDAHPGKPFFGLIDKTLSESIYKDTWVTFPWESGESEGTGIEDNVRRLLQFAGDDPNRGGLLETPHRVAKAYSDWFSGYNVDIGGLLKVFEDGAEGCDEMVMVRDIPIYSKCEHHMADIFGTATIAYIPNGRIVGLSKLSRLADAFARRLQVQERLTNQIADALVEHLGARGAGVIIKARHMCMESRGICQQGHHTVTSALRGVLKTDPAARAEFMTLAN